MKKVLGLYLAPNEEAKNNAIQTLREYFHGMVFSDQLGSDQPKEAFLIRELFPRGFKELIFEPTLAKFGIRKIG